MRGKLVLIFSVRYTHFAMLNKDIADLLGNVAAAYTIKDENKFRFQIIAYQKAASSIENSSTQISNLIKENKLGTLPGVGPSIREHLKELVKKGKVRHFEWVFKGIPDSVFPLLKIPSLGPKTAYKLVKSFNLKNPVTVITDIKLIAMEGKISKLAGFGEKSEKDILQVINEYEKGKNKAKRMTLPFAFQIAENIITHMRKSKDVIRVEALGSLRRMVPTVGDIDIAASTKHPRNVINHFTNYPYVERVLEKGDVSSSILVSGGHQVDLMIQPENSFGSLLQHFTGSKSHNIHLREYALKKGLSLSEYGIKKVPDKESQIKKYDSEDKFYKDLGLAWIPPELREDTGEIEQAAKGKLPILVDLNDIKGDLHVHSNFPIEPSHDLGKSSMEEILEKGKTIGYEYIGFAEHNPSFSKHSSSEMYKIIENKRKKIEQLNSGKKYIRSFNLLEVDINTRGVLPIDDRVLNLLDFAIVSIHTSFGLNKKEMTNRILKGLFHKKVKILGHPTGRMINERDEYELDWEKILNFCYKNKIALEINSWPNRLDIDDLIIRKAVDKNVKLAINTDSHAAYQMANMKFGIALAKRGWAKKSDIINTFSYNELSEWFNS
ncbi:MAG: hypothetical protein A2W22_04010 [Candidatus Levybacteria bacterium RBG_16_35_11]|nr:MAG: hypothetical protein A2W22_04010 [Candidatus Levybacteria bacterium RBG_16_35_11]